MVSLILVVQNLAQPKPGECFTYVFVPADDTKPLEDKTESSEGGLEDDKLMQALRSSPELGPNVDIMALVIPR